MSSVEPLEVLILGAGFGGLGMGIALKKAGERRFAILEKAAEVGGCWRENTYPGAACDVPSHLYSFSFEPKADWSRRFAHQAEILGYLKSCALKYGLHDHLNFNAEAREAWFDENNQFWVVKDAKGGVWRARHVVSAVGQLSRPLIPAIEGRSSFKGAVFHSAQWDHDTVIDGRRVVVIGTGASAIQFVPEVAKRAKSVTVFQRSGAWVIPKPDRAYGVVDNLVFSAAPLAQAISRAWTYVEHESRAIAFTQQPWILKLFESRARAQMRKHIKDPLLLQKIEPDYALGCKRVLISNDWYPALARANVDVVTEGVAHFEEHGVRDASGVLHEADVVIYGTGFAATEFLSPMKITGRRGMVLNEVWAKGAEAYLGMTVHGFPNFFMLYGPNTNLAHSSIVYMLESQIAHVMGALRLKQRKGASLIEVNADTQFGFNDRLQQRISKSVWDSGCTSWYKNESGKNTNNWPGFTFEYRWKTKKPDTRHYSLS